MRGRHGSARRALRRSVLLAVAVPIAAYAALLFSPQVLFAHELREGNLVFHARHPFPEGSRTIAASTLDCVSRSPFFDAGDVYHVFFCDTPAWFAFFALHHYRVGAIAQVGTTGHVYVRPAGLDRDRLIGPSGRDVPGERTLTYFLAHEIAHTMTARHVGRLAYLRLHPWQQEGYADYVGKAGAFDFAARLSDLRAGARTMDPMASGLYLRYHLLVAELLDRRGITPGELMAEPRDAVPIERELSRAR